MIEIHDKIIDFFDFYTGLPHTIADLPSFQSMSASNIAFIINLDKMRPGENLDVVVRNLKISCVRYM